MNNKIKELAGLWPQESWKPTDSTTFIPMPTPYPCPTRRRRRIIIIEEEECTPYYSKPYIDIYDRPCAIQEYFRQHPNEKSVCLYCNCPKCTPMC